MLIVGRPPRLMVPVSAMTVSLVDPASNVAASATAPVRIKTAPAQSPANENLVIAAPPKRMKDMSRRLRYASLQSWHPDLTVQRLTTNKTSNEGSNTSIIDTIPHDWR